MMFVPFQQPPKEPVKQVAKRTKSACINCKAAKVACSSERPCLWCLRHDLQDTCVDAPKKTRNTKRKPSDDKSPSDDTPSTPPTPPLSSSSSTSSSTSSTASTTTTSTFSRGHRRRTSSPHDTSSPRSIPSPRPTENRSPPTTSSTYRTTKGKPPPPLGEYDSADSDTPDLSTSSPPPSPYKLAPTSGAQSHSYPPNFAFSHPYNSMIVSVPNSTPVSPVFSSTPTTPSLSLPAPAGSPSSSLLPLSAFSPSPFTAQQQNPNSSQLQTHFQQPIAQHTIPYPLPPPPPRPPPFQYTSFHQSPSFPFQQSPLPHTSQPFQPDSTRSQQSFPDPISVLSPNVKSQQTLSPTSPSFQSPAPLYSSPSIPTTNFAFDSDEDSSRAVSDSVDCNNMLVQSLLTTQLALAQLGQVHSTSLSSTSTSSSAAIPSTNNTSSPISTPLAGRGIPIALPALRKSAVLNNLLLDELAKLQQCLETISALSAIQNMQQPTVFPSCTVRVGEPITVSDCNEAFAKLVGYEDSLQFFCREDKSLDTLVMPQFVSFISKKILKMAQLNSPKILQPTILVTKQGEVKSCCALLRNDPHSAKVCTLTIIKQHVTLTNRARELMNSPSDSNLSGDPTTPPTISQSTTTIDPTPLHSQWEKKT